jgi:hypothetical protein
MKMSFLVIRSVCDADMCGMLGSVHYSTDPRGFVTVEDMEKGYELGIVDGEY